jgi:hypothetical protein
MYYRKSNISKSMLLLTALLVSACGGSSISPPVLNPVMEPGGSNQPIPDGVWIQKGFGRALEVEAETIRRYDYSRETCFGNETITQTDITQIITIESVGMDEFIATEDSASLVFSKRESLPPACTDNRLITENGPVAALNHFTQNFSDYYPFFEERGILDWDERVRDAKMRVSENTTTEALVNEMIGLLSELDDSHVTLSDGTNFEFTPGRSNLEEVLVTGFENQSEFTNINEYIGVQFQRLESIRNSYFDDGSVDMAGGESQDVFLWATIGNGQVGYLEINGMGGISDDGSETDVDATEDLMDRILTDFANTEALIINVSINGGGELSVADAIANRFTTETLPVSSFQAISYDDSPMPQLTDLVHRDLSPTERVSYDRPIATISGPNTFSAAEHFLLSMRALNHPVCFVGEPSDGVLSAILDKPLPIETLQIGLTNMIVYDHTGQNFEVSGVPVDVGAVTFALADSEAERNQAIDASLEALGFGALANSDSQANDCSLTEARSRLEISAP